MHTYVYIYMFEVSKVYVYMIRYLTQLRSSTLPFSKHFEKVLRHCDDTESTAQSILCHFQRYWSVESRILV